VDLDEGDLARWFWAPQGLLLGAMMGRDEHFVWSPTRHYFAQGRERKQQCLVGRSAPFHARLMLFGCNGTQLIL
jgi:hypothetical protein